MAFDAAGVELIGENFVSQGNSRGVRFKEVAATGSSAQSASNKFRRNRE